MGEPITSKQQMYKLLSRGDFGNTIQQWFDVDEWVRDKEAQKYEWWGVRTLATGGPCRLNCPRSEVVETASRPEFQSAGVNLSLMVDRVCRVTLWADVYDSPTGLMVYGIEYPPEGGSWRALMPSKGRHYYGTAARAILRRHLNPNSLDDLGAVFEKWPEHICELSATDICIGTVPLRNSVVWEVRAY